MVTAAIVRLGDGNMPSNRVVNEFVEHLADYKQQLEEEKKNEKDDKKRANNAHHTPVATVAAEDATQLIT